MHGPAQFLFFGPKIEQDETFDITVRADQKLNTLESYPNSRDRRRIMNERPNFIEQKAFNSLNSSIEWLGKETYSLCSFY